MSTLPAVVIGGREMLQSCRPGRDHFLFRGFIFGTTRDDDRNPLRYSTAVQRGRIAIARLDQRPPAAKEDVRSAAIF